MRCWRRRRATHREAAAEAQRNAAAEAAIEAAALVAAAGAPAAASAIEFDGAQLRSPRGWLQPLRPYGAAGAAAACAFVVVTLWIGVQMPVGTAPAGRVFVHASAVVADSDAEPVLKRTDALASLDQLEASGGLVTR